MEEVRQQYLPIWYLGHWVLTQVDQFVSQLHFAGVVGLKPTYGLVSRYGLVAFASSLDQIGPITKDVEDSAILLNVIAGHDEKDSTSAKVQKVDYTEHLKDGVKGLRIGVPKEFFGEGINEEVKQKVKEAVKKYEEMGAIVEECSLDIADEALAVYYIIACAEASSNLGRFDGIRYGYRTEKFDNLKDIYRNSRSEDYWCWSCGCGSCIPISQ